MRKEFQNRIKALLITEWNTKNKVIAINTLTIPVMTKSFNIINWTLAEIKKKMDIKVWKLITL